MKIIFTFLCCIISAASSSQNTFKTLINTGRSQNILDVIQINDGSYIGIGSEIGEQSSPDILMVKLNAQGILLFSKNIRTGGYNVGVSIIKTADGGFAVSGSVYDELGILKFDGSLNLQWKKKYRFSNNSSDGTRLIQTAEGGFIVVGDVYSDDSDVGAGYLVKTDSHGNVLLARQYFNFSDNEYNIVDIVPADEGNYVLLAAVYDISAPDHESDSTYLVKIDSGGSILWSKYIKTSANSNEPRSLLRASDGGFVIAGSVDSLFTNTFYPSQIPQMLMTKFDAAGKLLWSKSVTTANVSTSFANSSVEDYDGGYIFCGELSNLDYNTNEDTSFAYIVKLSTNGILQWAKTFDKSSAFNSSAEFSTEFSSIIRSTDGGYLAAGRTALYPHTTALANGIFYKFDSNFQICGETGNNGTLINNGTAVAKSIAVHNITPVAMDVDIMVSVFVDTSVNYCCSAITIYTFNGSGDWSDPLNWISSAKPPSPLPQCSEIIINPAGTGECILNVPMIISHGDKIIVTRGKKFRINGNLIIN